MKKLALLTLAVAGAYAAFLYLDRRAMARERARFTPPADDMIARRVQAQLAPLVSDAGSLHVTAHGGVVTLRGSVEADGLDRALRAALSVPGVKSVLNRLETQGPARAIDDEQLPDLRIN
jgi:hypothetical protein